MTFRKKTKDEIQSDIKVFKVATDNKYKPNLKTLEKSCANKGDIDSGFSYQVYLETMRLIRKKFSNIFKDKSSSLTERNKKFIDGENSLISKEKSQNISLENRFHQDYIVALINSSNKNVGIDIPTAGGKTAILLKVIQNYVNNPENADKIILFTAPVRNLIEQHSEYVHTYFPELSHLMSTDSISKGYKEGKRIFITTPQSALSQINTGIENNELSPKQFGMYAVDEAHKGAATLKKKKQNTEADPNDEKCDYATAKITDILSETRIVASSADPKNKDELEDILKIDSNDWLSHRMPQIAYGLEFFQYHKIHESVSVPTNNSIEEIMSNLESVIRNIVDNLESKTYKIFKKHPTKNSLPILSQKEYDSALKDLNKYKGALGKQDYKLKEEVLEIKNLFFRYKSLIYLYTQSANNNYMVLVEKIKKIEDKKQAQDLLEYIKIDGENITDCLNSVIGSMDDKEKLSEEHIDNFYKWSSGEIDLRKILEKPNDGIDRLSKLLNFLDKNIKSYYFPSQELSKIYISLEELVKTLQAKKSLDNNDKENIATMIKEINEYINRKYTPSPKTRHRKKGSKVKPTEITENDEFFYRNKECKNAWGKAIDAYRNEIHHPKVEKLLEILNVIVKDRKQTVLVSVFEKQTILSFKEILEKAGYKVGILIGGQGSKPAIALNNKLLSEKLKNREIDIVIGTSASDEGWDQNFTCQIDYNQSSNSTQKIQRNGRAGRKKFGHVVSLISQVSGSTDELKNIITNSDINRRRKETQIDSILESDNLFNTMYSEYMNGVKVDKNKSFGFADQLQSIYDLEMKEREEQLAVYTGENSKRFMENKRIVFEERFRLIHVKKLLDKNNKPFLRMSIGDKTGARNINFWNIPANLFSDIEDMLTNNIDSIFKFSLYFTHHQNGSLNLEYNPNFLPFKKLDEKYYNTKDYFPEEMTDRSNAWNSNTNTEQTGNNNIEIIENETRRQIQYTLPFMKEL